MKLLLILVMLASLVQCINVHKAWLAQIVALCSENCLSPFQCFQCIQLHWKMLHYMCINSTVNYRGFVGLNLLHIRFQM